MAVLTREQARDAARRLKRREVHIPDWGGEVLVQQIRARDFIRVRDAISRGEHQLEYQAMLLEASVVNEDGTPFQTLDEWREWLGECSNESASLVIEAAMNLAGIATDDSAKKNSGDNQTDCSHSG